MKKIIILSISLMAFSMGFAQVKNNLEYYRYELECVGTGTDGTYLVKVWNYSKKSKKAIAEAKRNAVHGVIFKGFGGGPGCTGQKPLANSPGIEEQHKDFFEAFFADGGKYLKYVNESTDGSIDADDITKVGKEYKIGIVVSVAKDALRQDLEAAGIVKGLSSGF
jgi:hypothetical protein